MATAADFCDRAVYLPDADALVLADVHLGLADASDVDAPLGEREDLATRLDVLLDRFAPGEVVVAGDCLHAFDHVPLVARRTLDDLSDHVAEAGARLVMTPGNHDSHLASVFDGPTPDAHRLDDGTLVCHGHEAPDPDAVDGPVTRYVVGHDHPAIVVEGVKRPCFLYGPEAYRGTDVLVLPAFNRLTGGVTVNERSGTDFASPLVRSLGAFHPILRDPDDDETLRFPPLSKLRGVL